MATPPAKSFGNPDKLVLILYNITMALTVMAELASLLYRPFNVF
jgi:hypothetical protein